MKVILSLAAFSVLLVGGLVAYTRQSINERSGQERTANGLKIVYNLIVRRADDTYQFRGKQVKYLHDDGRSKEIRYNPAGEELGITWILPDGKWIGVPSKQILSPAGKMEVPSHRSEERMAKDARGDVRSFLGYKVYVRKDAKGMVEIWSSPEVKAPLKRVLYPTPELTTATILEATAIDRVYLDDAFFEKPAWRHDTFYLESQINSYERMGKDASQYKKELEKWKK